MEEKNTNDKKIKKAGIAALSVSVLTAGTVGLVSAYQSGTDYKPAGSGRDIHKNQVVFDNNEDTVGHKKNKTKDKSELLKKDQNTQKGAEKESDSNYLFEKGNMLMPDGVTTVGVSDDNLTGTTGTSDGNTMYKLTDDPSKADTILSNRGNLGSGNGGSGSHSSGGNNGDNGNSGSGNHSNGSGNGSSHGQGSNSQNGNQNNSGDHNNGQTEEPQKPTRLVDKVKDPESQKVTPIGGYYDYRPYKEGVKPSDKGTEEHPSVVIEQSEDIGASKLYKGQSVDKKTIYNALNTYVHGDDGIMYVWGADALDKYVQIASVSFDGGTTWESAFPVTIPSDIEDGQMKIKVEYRLSVNDAQWTERVIDYTAQENRIFVLSRKLTDEDESIDTNIILNTDKQYLENGTVINLFRQQENLLKGEKLTELFPGWTENGELVPWYYTATSGRHVLEPADMVPLDSKYVVKLEMAWMSDDYQVGDEYSTLGYLQTLTDIDSPISVHWTDESWHNAWLYDKISVPEYVQAVMIDEDADMSVNYLEIPDTVLYIKTENSGMRVNDGYIVDKNNRNYDATKDGMLMNKDDTAILSIPYKKEEITIPKTVRSVVTEKKNQLKTIYLEAGSKEELPDINYKELSDCKIVLQDDMLESFLENNQETFTKKTGNRAAALDNPDVSYTVQKGIITDNSGNVRRILDNGNVSVCLANDMESIENGAFEGVDGISALVMPKNGKEIRLDEGCFSGSQLKAVRCYTQEQYDSVMAQIGTSGAPEDLSVELIQESKEGYWYTVDTLNGVEESVVIAAPKDVEEFDGTVTAEDGTIVDISVIGDDAFEDCEKLKWAVLPEKVSTIGYRAFENCTSLEGVLINNKESITIGNEAWEACSSLRFIASNAMNCTLKNDYDPFVTDSYGSESQQRYFFTPTNSEGYGSYYMSFTEESGVYGYTLKDLGSDGKMLYGTDENGQEWIALRSSKEVPEQVELPSGIKEIYRYAMADTESNSGEYSVNFKDTEAWAIDTGAFYNSKLGGDIELNNNSWLFDYAMYGCSNITSIRMPGEDIIFGEGAVSGCSSLKNVYIGKLRENIEFCAGTFTGCDALTDITLDDENPPKLFLFSTGSPYRFNTDWTLEEESEKLRLHVPKGAEKDYIRKWRYGYIGYSSMEDTPAYISLWNDIYYDNIDWDTGEVPENVVVDQAVEEKVLNAENRIRTFIGIENVSEPTEYYPYHLIDNNYVMLAGAPSDTEELDLGDTVLLDLPDGWFLDGIEKGAFSKCSSLQKVVIPSNMVEIDADAFEGVKSGMLTLEFADGGDPVTLKCEDGTPYSFGVDESSLYLKVPEGREDEFIKAWAFPMAGYTDLDAMRNAVKEELAQNDPEVTDEAVDAEIANRLLPIENRLRTMMHIDTVETLNTEKYGLGSTKKADSEEGTTDETDAKGSDTEESGTDKNNETESKKESETVDSGTEQDNLSAGQTKTDAAGVEGRDLNNSGSDNSDAAKEESPDKNKTYASIIEEKQNADTLKSEDVKRGEEK